MRGKKKLMKDVQNWCWIGFANFKLNWKKKEHEQKVVNPLKQPISAITYISLCMCVWCNLKLSQLYRRCIQSDEHSADIFVTCVTRRSETCAQVCTEFSFYLGKKKKKLHRRGERWWDKFATLLILNQKSQFQRQPFSYAM